MKRLVIALGVMLAISLAAFTFLLWRYEAAKDDQDESERKRALLEERILALERVSFGNVGSVSSTTPLYCAGDQCFHGADACSSERGTNQRCAESPFAYCFEASDRVSTEMICAVSLDECIALRLNRAKNAWWAAGCVKTVYRKTADP